MNFNPSNANYTDIYLVSDNPVLTGSLNGYFVRLGNTTDEVSFDQAAGNEELPAERAVSWTKHDKIVVAVHQHGPISVRVEDKSLTQR